MTGMAARTLLCPPWSHERAPLVPLCLQRSTTQILPYPDRNPPKGPTVDDTNARLAALSGTRSFEDLPNRHSCGTRWSGSNTCHCAAPGCCRTFVGIGAFDRHRKGGTCADPASVGMALAPGRAYDAWTIAETAEQVAA